MMYKEVHTDPQTKNRTLHVFWNGRHIYKRKVEYGYGIVFDLYGPPFLPSHPLYENNFALQKTLKIVQSKM